MQQGSYFRSCNIREQECIQKVTVQQDTITSYHEFGGFFVYKSLKLMLTVTPSVAQWGEMGIL